jgi:hypothetical protein
MIWLLPLSQTLTLELCGGHRDSAPHTSDISLALTSYCTVKLAVVIVTGFGCAAVVP